MSPFVQDHRRVFNAPRVILILIAAMVAVHGIRLLLDPALDNGLVMTFAVVPARYFAGAAVTVPVFPGGAAGAAAALITYTFLHGGWLHLGINSIWLLALGTGVARRLGTARFLWFYFICGALAGLTYAIAQPGSLVPAVGASGAVSGLLGAVIRFNAHDSGTGRGGRLLSVLDRRVLVVALLWIGFNVAFGRTGLSGLTAGQPIAWEAHLGGFVAGLALFGLFDRRAQGTATPKSGDIL